MKKKKRMCNFVDGQCEAIKNPEKFVLDWFETGGNPCTICGDSKIMCCYYEKLVESGVICEEENKINLANRLPANGHSILVMDDEQTIRDLTAIMLKHLGYSATTCVNGEEAIELYKKAKELGTPYLAVIVDLKICRGMGGQDAASQILLIDPDAKLIATSAYVADPIMVNYESFGFVSSLPKPFKLSDMAEVLAAALSL